MNTPEDPSSTAEDQSEAPTDDGVAGLGRAPERSGGQGGSEKGDLLDNGSDRSGKAGG